MQTNNIKYKLYRMLTGVMLLTACSLAIGKEVAFFNASDLKPNDEYVIVLGSKPTEATPSYFKQIQYSTIDTNTIAEITYNSKGVHINVAEMDEGNNAELINEIYQVYDQGIAVLYFDARHDKKLIEYRNRFILENFDKKASSMQFQTVVTRNTSTALPFNAAPSKHLAMDQASASGRSLCNKQGLFMGQIANLISAFSPLFKSFELGLSADILASGFNAGRLLSCYEESQHITRAEIYEMADRQIQQLEINKMMDEIKSIGYDMERDLYLIKNSASTKNKEQWINDRIKRIKPLYSTLGNIGHKASRLLGQVAALEMLLVKKLYQINEKSSLNKKKQTKDIIASKTNRPISVFQEQLAAFTKQEETGKRSRLNYHNSLGSFPHLLECGLNSEGKPGYCTFQSYWGKCHQADEWKKPTGHNCYTDGTTHYASRYDAEYNAHDYAEIQLARYKARNSMSRIGAGARDYSNYFRVLVKDLDSNSYPPLKTLLNSMYLGFKLHDTVSIHQHGNQRGYEIILKPGSYDLIDLERKGMINNDLSSISIPPGLKVTLYQNDDFTGWRKSYSSDTNLTGQYNDAASSIKVEFAPSVILYQHGNYNKYKDQYGEFTRGYFLRLPSGTYHLADLKSKGMEDNDVSSLTVPRGLRADLYNYDYSNGLLASYTSNKSLPSSQNDQLTSIKISAPVRLTMPKSGLLRDKHMRTVVEYDNVQSNPKNWIGLYNRGAGNVGSLVWQYVSGDKGRVEFVKELPAGKYSARLFANDGYDLIKEIDFDVAATLATSKLKYLTVEDVNIEYQGDSGHPKSWIGLYKRGAGNVGSLVWKYIDDDSPPGKTSFPTALPPGDYSARLFRDNGYNLMAEFDFTVVLPN